MNRFIKTGILAVSLSAAVPALAGDTVSEEAVGWTPVELSLASPVALPYGINKWDVFGLGIGLFYIDTPKMYGLDIGGATTTRDLAIGLIVGGLFNYAGADVYGLRASLGPNFCNATAYGMDAGLFGYHRNIVGLDVEFLGCVQERMTGVLIGGIVNLTEQETCGVTIAGGVNLAKVAYGAQIAGVFNQTDELHGFQLGLVNFAKECPFGFQLGLVNIIMDNTVKVLPIVNGYF